MVIMVLLLKISLLVLLAFLFQHVMKFLLLLDLTKHVHRHAPGPCHLVPGVEHGSEGIQIMQDGIALISSGLRYQETHKKNPNYKDFIGRMLMFDMHRPEEGAIEVKVEGQINMTNFNPHGLSIVENNNGKTTVFIVNHPLDQLEDSVEKFIWNKNQKTLIHQETIQHPFFKLLNDIRALGNDKFYVTNHHYAMSNIGRMFELFALRPWGQVVFWHNGDAHIAADGMMNPNGITTSHDNRYVYVVAEVGQYLKVFERQEDNSMKYLNAYPLNTKADNLDIDADGDLWTGAHPSAIQILQHLEDPKVPSSSQVLRLRMDEAELGAIEEIYADNGQDLYASGAAAYFDKGLLIGTVAHKLMYCDITFMEP